MGALPVTGQTKIHEKCRSLPLLFLSFILYLLLLQFSNFILEIPFHFLIFAIFGYGGF